jgi:hypothetical protein
LVWTIFGIKKSFFPHPLPAPPPPPKKKMFERRKKKAEQIVKMLKKTKAKRGKKPKEKQLEHEASRKILSKE